MEGAATSICIIHSSVFLLNFELSEPWGFGGFALMKDVDAEHD